MKWSSLIEECLFFYCSFFTGITLWAYVRGGDLDIPWFATLSTAPVVTVILVKLFRSRSVEQASRGTNG